MKKILTIIGARPQFVKAAAISHTFQNELSNELREIIIHTGQHYDENMSEIFFEQLNLPKPFKNLEIHGLSNEEQVKRMTLSLGKLLKELTPEGILAYGDTNSTRAAALIAHEHKIPFIHIEAGLRSFNSDMPEELNRIIADQYATLLFVPTLQGMKNLEAEGKKLSNNPPFSMENPGIFHCGDIMLDNALYYSKIAHEHSDILNRYGIQQKQYLLATIHRESNTDNLKKLRSIFDALLKIGESEKIPILIPLHPRTKKMLDKIDMIDINQRIRNHPFLKLIPPVSYVDMIQLESHAELVLTDSGGVQKEAFFFKKPCVILRAETEWVELVENGNALIADTDTESIILCYNQLKNKKDYTWPPYYGDGRAAQFICHKIIQHI